MELLHVLNLIEKDEEVAILNNKGRLIHNGFIYDIDSELLTEKIEKMFTENYQIVIQLK